MADAKEAAAPLLALLQETIDGLDRVAGLAGSFYDDGKGGAQAQLNREVRDFEARLAQLDAKRDSLAPLGAAAMVPIDLLDHVDREDKCNPDLYTRHKVEFVLEEKLRLQRNVADFERLKEQLGASPAGGAAVPGPGSGSGSGSGPGPGPGSS